MLAFFPKLIAEFLNCLMRLYQCQEAGLDEDECHGVEKCAPEPVDSEEDADESADHSNIPEVVVNGGEDGEGGGEGEQEYGGGGGEIEEVSPPDDCWRTFTSCQKIRRMSECRRKFAECSGGNRRECKFFSRTLHAYI